MKRVFQKLSDSEYKDITPNGLWYPEIEFIKFLKNNLEKYWNIKPLKVTSENKRYEIIGFDYNYNRVVLVQFNNKPYHDLIQTRYYRMIFEDRWLHDCLGNTVSKINLGTEKINTQLSKLLVFRFNSTYKIRSLIKSDYRFTTNVHHPHTSDYPFEVEIRNENVNYLGVEVWNVSNIKDEFYHIECLNDGSLILNDIEKIHLEKFFFNSLFVSKELIVIYYGLKEFLNLVFGGKTHVNVVTNLDESISNHLVLYEDGGYRFFNHDTLSNLDFKRVLVLYCFNHQNSIGVNLILEFKHTNILVKLFLDDNNKDKKSNYFGDYLFSSDSTFNNYFDFLDFLKTKIL